MKFARFRVFKYRNIVDSGWIDINDITAFVGQNEAGKSNLFDALYRVKPFDKQATYRLDEDWPVNDWGNKGKDKNHIVCKAEFLLTKEEIENLFASALVDETEDEEENEQAAESDETEDAAEDEGVVEELPKSLVLEGRGYYNFKPNFYVEAAYREKLDQKKVQSWAVKNVPNFVYIHDYEMSGTQVELDQLKQRTDATNWEDLSNEDQTILTILELANIDLDEFIEKGQTTEGRTTRAFDKRQASAYLTSQFADLWRQKDVRFDIEVDGTTLNVFVEDANVGMPVRLNRRSTGFRWYVSFAWKFTQASEGEYENCILLLEEPGVHLHYDGQRDLLEVLERLSQDNTILYTTHLASMVDLGNPERIRIVETSDDGAVVKAGVVSSQRAPMAVIELCLGLTGDMCGLLGNRQTLIVEGGDDSLILYKLSALLKKGGKAGLSDRIYLWPAKGAQQTPMYAAFAIGHKWDAAVLLDSDIAGNEARTKIEELYVAANAEQDDLKFKVIQIGHGAGITKTDSAIEDLFPDQFYIDRVNESFGLAIKIEDLPEDGSDMIVKQVEHVLVNKHGYKKLDKRRVLNRMLDVFDGWNSLEDLPEETLTKAEKLFAVINSAFESS